MAAYITGPHKAFNPIATELKTRFKKMGECGWREIHLKAAESPDQAAINTAHDTFKDEIADVKKWLEENDEVIRHICMTYAKKLDVVLECSSLATGVSRSFFHVFNVDQGKEWSTAVGEGFSGFIKKAKKKAASSKKSMFRVWTDIDELSKPVSASEAQLAHYNEYADYDKEWKLNSEEGIGSEKK
eukprot:844869_1